MTTVSSKSPTLHQLVRYGIVGLISNSFGYAIFLWLTYYIGVGPKQAMSLLYWSSIVISYLGNWRWTFIYSGGFWETSSRFFLTHLFGYLLNLTLLFLLVDKLQYPYQWIQAVATIIVALFIFTAFKTFVFKASKFEFMDENMS